MYSLFINIGFLVSISVLSFYDRNYFSFHVVDILQAFGLAIITMLDISFPVNYFSLSLGSTHYYKYIHEMNCINSSHQVCKPLDITVF